MECFVESSKIFGAGMLLGAVIGFVSGIVLILDVVGDAKRKDEGEDDEA
jgi:gas vesicle protein